MPHTAVARMVTRDRDAGRYQRHRPEQTLLYQIIEQHYPAFTEQLAAQGTALPGYVQREFEDYLKCGRLEHGFLRVRCESCHAEHLVAFSWPLLCIPAPAAFVNPITSPRRGFCPSCGTRRMTESAALNLNIHLTCRDCTNAASAGCAGAAHMLLLDGVYVDHPNGITRFRWVKAPTSQEVTQLAHTIAQRVGRFLERQGLPERDAENSYLASDAVDDDPMAQLLGHSITYRIAIGPQAGRKVFSLQTLPAYDLEDHFGDSVGQGVRFTLGILPSALRASLRLFKIAPGDFVSLHAGVAARAHERRKIERLCRYISRPAVSEKRLSLTPNGNIR